MTTEIDAILSCARQLSRSCDGHQAFITAGNKEYFSYIIMDESEFTVVNGETNGNFITDTHVISPLELVEYLRSYFRSQLIFFRSEFPPTQCKPFEKNSDLLLFMEAESRRLKGRQGFAPQSNLTAYVKNSTTEIILDWARETFAKVDFSGPEKFIYSKDEKIPLTITPAKNSYSAVNIVASKPPILPWYSSLALARSIFLATGLEVVSSADKIVDLPELWYLINKEKEEFIKNFTV